MNRSLLQKVALSFDFNEFDDEDDEDELSDSNSDDHEHIQPVAGTTSCVTFSFHVHASWKLTTTTTPI